MSLDDLRRELRNRAGDPGTTSMSDRLAGVQTKVAVARRRKAVATGVATLATLAVVGVAAPQLVGGDGGDEMADAELVRMPESLNGDLQIAARYNEGAGELSWRVPLDDLDVVTRTTCVLPDDPSLPSPGAPVMLAWTIDGGGPVLGDYETQCGIGDDPGVGSLGPATRADWQGLGAARGTEIEIEVRLEQEGQPIEVPGAQFGVALYDKTGERQVSHGIELSVLIDVAGETYRLEKHKTRPLAEYEDGARVLRLRTPAADVPAAVVYGWDSEIPTAGYVLTQDGERLATGYGGHLEGPRPIEGDTEHLLALRAGGASAEGVLVLAFYVLDDD